MTFSNMATKIEITSVLTRRCISSTINVSEIAVFRERLQCDDRVAGECHLSEAICQGYLYRSRSLWINDGIHRAEAIDRL